MLEHGLELSVLVVEKSLQGVDAILLDIHRELLGCLGLCQAILLEAVEFFRKEAQSHLVVIVAVTDASEALAVSDLCLNSHFHHEQ